MTQKKIEKEFVYEGLGFPVVLINVPMILVRGIWTIDCDLNILQKATLLALAHSAHNLTGNQIHFIRSWLGLTQSKFGDIFGITHVAVVKWEKMANKSSKMSLNTQREIRMWILDHLLTQDEDFRKAFKIIHAKKFSDKVTPLKIDAPIDLVAI